MKNKFGTYFDLIGASNSFVPAKYIPTQAEEKLTTFSKFKNGWHYGDGEAFASDVIIGALNVIFFIKSDGLSELDAFPGFNGEIRITAYDQSAYFEITVNKDLSFDFLYEVDDQVSRQDSGLSLAQVKKLLCESINVFRWNLSESLPHTITTKGKKDLIALPLKTHHQKWVAGSQLSNVPAQSHKVVAFAHTSGPNIQIKGLNHTYFGNSMEASYHPVE